MKRAIKIENLPALDETSRDVLRVIALHLGDREGAYVDYTTIAKSLDLTRPAVASAVERLKKKRVLAEEHGRLKIINSVLV